jgi:hypothetical protein
MPVTPGSYEVDVTWAVAGILSTNVTYNVYDGTNLLGSVSVDQQTALSGATYDGNTWQSLGNFTITGTQLKVTVANSASDGQVCADAVRILPAYQPTEMVANTYPGSWVSPTGWTAANQGLFGQALVSNTATGSKTSQAAWWFPCQPGQYEVDVTWQPGGTYSQSVGFDVYNGLKWIKTATVNEQNAPSGTTDQGVVWQSLGIFTVTRDMLHVSTWNSPTDGAICVDGVRIVPVGTTTNGVEQPASAAMAVVAPATSVPLATTSSSASGGWLIDSTLTTDARFSPTAGLPQFSSTENRAIGAVPLKAIDPQVLDKIDLLSIAEEEMGSGGLDTSLDLLMSDQLGVGVRRLT